MEVQTWKIGDVHPYKNNPRNNTAAVKPVANSIKEFGFQQPIVVDKDGVIIVGHTRYKAAKMLKLKEVPVVVAGNLTPDQVKAYRVADNSTGEVAVWDIPLLNAEIQGLDYDFADFGLNVAVQQVDGDAEDDDYDMETTRAAMARKSRTTAWMKASSGSSCSRPTAAPTTPAAPAQPRTSSTQTPRAKPSAPCSGRPAGSCTAA